MNKKVGIVTHHNSFNYGAALQAYATVSFLKNNQLEPIIIDYCPDYLQGFGTYKKTYSELSLNNTNIIKRVLFTLIKTPSYKRLKKRFDDFSGKEFPLTKPYFSLEELKNDLPNCYAYCTGSDQVWNNYYTHEFDSVYFLDFVPSKSKCFSIASSFGKESFTEEELAYIKEKTKKYDYISVREETGLKILSDVDYSNAKLMLDPTLLVSTKEWKKLLKPIQNTKPYILVYQLHGDSNALDLAMKFGKKNKMQVISLVTMYHQIRPGCKNVIIPQVPEFLGLFEGAEYVFTDSFHGTVYSLQFEKKLAAVLPHKFSNRITTLLNAIDAKDFIVNDINQWFNSVDKIDYKQLTEKLNALRIEKATELKDYLSTL